MHSLPVDLQVLILPLLTSTSLISLSQTNRYFRCLIDPQRQQFLDRLWEIECLPEYGGEITLDERAKIVVPPGRVAYACAQCLRIISHTNFDNHALLRRNLRKPPPHARVSQQLCGWMDGDAKAKGLKRQADLRHDTMENWKKENRSSALSDSEIEELYWIGSRRDRRACNECKFVSGHWARNIDRYDHRTWRLRHRNSNVGIREVPVITGRQRRCHDSTERYFWQLFPVTDEADYPLRNKIYREENHDWWTLWSIRCRGCARWQERAAYRRGSGYGVKATPANADMWRHAEWTGPHFEDWRCNRCVASTLGEEELARQLLAFWKKLVDWEIQNFALQQGSGWFALKDVGQLTKGKHSWEQIVREDPTTPKDQKDVPSMLKGVQYLGHHARRHYFAIFRRWLKSSTVMLYDDSDKRQVEQWSNAYDSIQNRVSELEAQTKLLEGDPNRLVRYALDNDASLV